ncbi:MAG TPA: mucoidy inhibitor MuiA family protein [Puia sp.]|uniref:mucoidy inhibitor MuiA family protein n=1 Tax=Puia sp. TaxID=2045100 RepID=UPI002C6E743B|nr:mucoidy inhibitor MuiA family protein [Puia sp.]HVU96669.1 mucoidy inhibitor MuiA family protein [Puia sp.]
MRPFFFSILLFSLAARAGDGKNIISSTLTAATVYRSGAELVHTATARLERGANELIVGDLSNTIDVTSIRIGCSANVTVLSVTFSTDHLQTEVVSPFVKKLQDSIGSIKKELGRLDILVKSDNELLDLLATNKSIGSTTMGVSVAELAKMVDYYRQKALELRTEISGYTDRSQQLKQVIDRLGRQIKEDERKNASTAGSLVLQLMSPSAGPCDLTISYLTTAAHWEPYYDLKVVNSTDPLHIFYKAHVVQTSGIDWKHVKLSLSTSLPAQGGNAPVLNTWFLQFVNPIAGYVPAAPMSNVISGVRVRGTASLSEVAVTGFASRPEDGSEEAPSDPLYIVNGKEVSKSEFTNIDPRAIKKLDVLKDNRATALYGARAAAGVILVTLKDELGDYVSLNDRTMDAVFEIDIPYDVPGNGMEQGVTLKEYQLPCVYQYYAVPCVDKDAYLLGQLTGWEKLNLLPGDAGIMVEGTYIGRSRIDPGYVQDTMNLTLGRDKRIVVKKEKVTDFSSVKFLGSNRKQVFTYRITVRNNKKEKIRMILKDQYPISSDKEIEEELLENGGATVNKDTGILTWNLELAPGESRSYRISYSVKYPKDKVVNIN